MKSFITELIDQIDLHTLANNLAGWAPRLLSALFMLLLFWLVWMMARKGLDAVLRRAGIDSTLITLVQSTAKIVIGTIGTVTVLGQLGVDIAGLLTGLGVAGLTIGFAARDALSNMISGFLILWDRPFTIGDLIDIGGDYGHVEAITLRTTRVVTLDGRMLAIPNTEIVNKVVASYTNFPHLRLDIDFTVGVNEDLERARQVALSICEGDARLMSDPAPGVVVTALNDYNVAMQFRVWLGDERSHVPVRYELREKLFLALRKADIEMPYETFVMAPQAG